MIIHDYLCILRHKKVHSYACYHIFNYLSIILWKIIIISKIDLFKVNYDELKVHNFIIDNMHI